MPHSRGCLGCAGRAASAAAHVSNTGPDAAQAHTQKKVGLGKRSERNLTKLL